MDSKSARPFGFWTLTLLVVANMIGSGVFTTSGFTIQSLGSRRLTMLAWFVAGIIALTGAVSYGRLSRLMPQSGGEYLFLSRAVHPLAGFLAGWISIFAGFSGAIALAATTMEAYVWGEARPAFIPEDGLAIVAILGAGLLHGWRVRTGAAVQNLTVLLKLVLMLGFVGLALSRIAGGADVTETSLAEPGAVEIPHGTSVWLAFATSLVWISLSYSGFNAAVYVAGEADEGQRVVRRALLTGTAITMLLYLLLNGVFVYGAAPAEIAGKPNVAIIAAEALGGTMAARFIQIIVVIALLTSISSMLMAAPRVYARMADDGLLPSWLRIQSESPWIPVLVQVAISVGLVLATKLRGLLGYLSLTLSLCAAATVACLFLPRIRQQFPATERGLFCPLLFVCATISSGFVMAGGDTKQFLALLTTLLVGLVLYPVAKKI